MTTLPHSSTSRRLCSTYSSPNSLVKPVISQLTRSVASGGLHIQHIRLTRLPVSSVLLQREKENLPQCPFLVLAISGYPLRIAILWQISRMQYLDERGSFKL